MRNAAMISGSIHVAAIALAVAGLPSLFDSDPAPEQPVMVELVSLPEQALEQKKSKPAEQPRKKPPPPKPEKVEKPPPPPPTPEPEVAPPAPEPEPAPIAKPIPKAKPKIKPKPKPPRKAKPPKRVARVAPKPRRKPRPLDNLNSILLNLQKQKQQAALQKKKDEDKDMRDVLNAARPPKKAPPPPSRVSSIDRRRDAMMLARAVMRQVTPCWSIPGGIKDAHTMRVGVRIFLNPDGTLNGSPRIEDIGRMGRDPAFRALAESALRALQNPECSPLRLPIKEYDSWREISFNFDPRELLR